MWMELGETQSHFGFGRNRVKLAGQEAEVGKCVWNQAGLWRGGARWDWPDTFKIGVSELS